MKRTSRWVSIGLVALLLGLLIGGGFALFGAFRHTAGYHLQAGETSYQAGVNAMAAGQVASALVRFHEAQLQGDLALKASAALRTNGGELTADQQALLVRQEGLAWWLKVRALKARAVAKVHSEGKALPLLDGVGPEQFEAYLTRLLPSRLPVEEYRDEALLCLRGAAQALPDLLPVQSEAVYQEMQFEPKNWPFAEQVARQLQALDAKDVRAAYVLARFDFEQPVAAAAGQPARPLPLAKRSRERMTKALQHVQQVRAGEEPPRWRTTYLAAQILVWLRDQARQPGQRKPEAERQAALALMELLFDPTTGALARARTAAEFGPLSRLDAEGLLYLHQLAVEMALDQERLPADVRAAVPAVTELLAAAAATARKVAAEEQAAEHVGRTFAALTEIMVKVRPELGPTPPPIWPEAMACASELAARTLRDQQGSVEDFCRWARLQASEGDAGRTQALATVAAALEQTTQRRQPAADLLPLHDLALRLKAQASGNVAELTPHLEALRAAREPRFRARAFLYEGSLLEREGRLERARAQFEQAAALAPGSATALRAHAVLPTLYLALEQPTQALASLAECEKVLRRVGRSADHDRFAEELLVPSLEEIQALQFKAHLAAAHAAFVRRSQDAANERQWTAQFMDHERAAAALLGAFSGPRLMAAREQLAIHLIRTRRWDQAEERIAELMKEAPASVSGLRLKHRLTLARLESAAERATVAAAIEGEIRALVRQHPQDEGAKLYLAEWQLSQGQTAAAVAFLADPAQFPVGSASPELRRLRAWANAAAPAVATAAANATANGDEIVPTSHVEDATPTNAGISPHLDSAIQRCAAAAQAARQRDFAEAAKLYAACLELTRIKPLARAGLRGALLEFARENPSSCRELCAELLQEQPAEPTLLAGYAECCFLLGDLGNPQAPGRQVRDVASALAAYEQAMIRDKADPAAGPWLQAQYWVRANRPDWARTELARLLARTPNHVDGLRLTVQLALAENCADGDAEAERWLARLEKVRPDCDVTDLLLAQLLERRDEVSAAQSAYERCITRNPNCVGGWLGLVQLREAAADEAGTFAVVKRWRAARPGDVLAAQAEVRCLARTGQMAEIAAVRERLLQHQAAEAQASQNQAAVTLALAQGMLQAGRADDAERWLRELLEQQPNLEAGWLLLGDVGLAKLKEATAPADRDAAARMASDAFAKVYAQRKGHLLAGNNLAWLATTVQNDAEEALRLLQEVRENRTTRQPMTAEQLPAAVLDTFGLAYGKLNRPELAAAEIELFEAARRRYPRDPRFALYLGQAFARAGKKREAQQQFAAAQTLAARPRCGLPEESRSQFEAEVRTALAALK